MRRAAENLRRIKRRDVVSEKVMVSLKRRPRGINDEAQQPEKDEQRLRPPNVGAHRLTKRTPRDAYFCAVHLPSAPSIGNFAFFHASQLPGTFHKVSKPSSFKMLAAMLAR